MRPKDLGPIGTAEVEIVAGTKSRSGGLGNEGPFGFVRGGQIERPRGRDKDFALGFGDFRQFSQRRSRDMLIGAAGRVAGGRAARSKRITALTSCFD